MSPHLPPPPPPSCKAEASLKRSSQHREHCSATLQDVRRQLYGDEDDRKFFQWVQSQLKQTETRLESGRAVLHHLEAQLINVACDDPGAAIGAQLALPLLQERLDAKAQEFARQKAAQAEEDIIKMEVGSYHILQLQGCELSFVRYAFGRGQCMAGWILLR